jgi:hypothetical protein
MEIWKPCVGYEWNYEVSNLGRVRSIGKGIILKTKIDKGGYETIPSMYDINRNVKTVKVHRLVALAFIPNPRNVAQVNHKDGDKLNNRVENLEWCTHKENFIHAKLHGLRPKGEDHGRHKLTWNDVNYIRRVHCKGDLIFGAKALAEKFNVTPRVISLIIRNEIWKVNDCEVLL